MAGWKIQTNHTWPVGMRLQVFAVPHVISFNYIEGEITYVGSEAERDRFLEFVNSCIKKGDENYKGCAYIGL